MTYGRLFVGFVNFEIFVKVESLRQVHREVANTKWKVQPIAESFGKISR